MIETIDDGLAFLTDYWAREDALFLAALDALIAGERGPEVRRGTRALIADHTLRGTSDPDGMQRVLGDNGITPIERPNRFTPPDQLVRQRDAHRPRQVHAATCHPHPVLGRVVCVWTDSLDPTWRDAPHRRYAVATLDRERIVQMASVCRGCYLTGIQGGHGTYEARGWTDGPACPACDARGALHEWGLDVGPLAERTEACVRARPEAWMFHAWLDRLG